MRKVIDLVRPLGYEIRFLGNTACAYKPALDPASSRHQADFDDIATDQPDLIRSLALGSLRRTAK